MTSMELPLPWWPERGLVLLKGFLTTTTAVSSAEPDSTSRRRETACVCGHSTRKEYQLKTDNGAREEGVGVGRGGADRPAARNWFPKGKSQRAVMS